jgi:ferric-dicitrate binding protein FerR (iron transport regulator)
MIDNNRLSELLSKKLLGKELSDHEALQLEEWLQENSNKALYETELNSHEVFKSVRHLSEMNEQRLDEKMAVLRGQKPVNGVLRTMRPYMVAACLAGIALAIGIVYMRSLGDRKSAIAARLPKQQSDRAPGKDRAILTLANGTQVNLDSISAGQVAAQGSVHIVKQSNGLIAYEVGRTASKDDLAYNTLHTPNAGQYQLRLPDGTRVYVNNASDLRYPVAFNGLKREVFLSGEAYFEVERDDSKPFIVHLKNQENIEVLGTRFDIAAYPDEPNASRTVLVDGKVKVDFKEKAVVLKPGQQAVNNGKNLVVDNANIRSALAWKNGFFSFDDATAAEILTQLSRWYDVPVRVNNESAQQRRFEGRMSRDLTLRQALKILQDQQLPYVYDEDSGAIVEEKK